MPRLDLPASLCGLLLVAGCAETFPTMRVEVAEQVRAPSLLVSELLAAEDPGALLDCPVLVTNHSDSPQTLTLVSTGCSCYGFTHNGQVVARGESVRLPAGETLRFGMRSRLHAEELGQDFRATVEVTQPDSPSVQITTQCRLNIYDDLALTPGIITLSTPPHAELRTRRPVSIAHVYRAESPRDAQLELGALPAGLEIVGLASAGPHEKLEDDLWRATWTGELDINLPPDPAGFDAAVPLRAAVRVADQLVAQGQGEVIVQITRPIVYPAEIHFGHLPLGRPRQRRILLSGTAAAAFDLRLDEPLPDWLQLNIPADPQPRHWLEFTVTPQTPGPFEHELKLRTSLPSEPEVRMHLAGVAGAAEDESAAE